MKITNKSELMSAAWKIYRNPKNAKTVKTFSEALKMAWSMFKECLVKANRKPLEGLEKDLYKAMKWSQEKVAKLSPKFDFDHFKKFYENHKNEGTIYQVAAKFARLLDADLRSYM